MNKIINAIESLVIEMSHGFALEQLLVQVTSSDDRDLAERFSAESGNFSPVDLDERRSVFVEVDVTPAQVAGIDQTHAGPITKNEQPPVRLVARPIGEFDHGLILRVCPYLGWW